MAIISREQEMLFVPKAALRALVELTGQVELGPAILMTLRDAIEHRLEAIEADLCAYEQRYGMTFEKFEARGRSDGLPERFSYPVEQDYFGWDSLVARRRKLKEILQWLT